MDRIDNYKIVEKIGEGGMGEVYKGIDTMLEREVAIKMLHPDLSRRADIVERFRTEAIALGRLNHTHIATVYNFGRCAEQYYMAMEFVPGETLEQRIKTHKTLPWREAVDYAIQALQGLAQAHQAGVIHRDIKPSNIIITPDGKLKLLDFGIARILQTARLTKTRHTIGTPEYMSPEQHLGTDVDARSDIYAVGMLLYEMLLGELPFQGDTEYALIKNIIEDNPTRLRQKDKSIPQTLENQVMKALEKQPNKRFAEAEEFITALTLCLTFSKAEPKATRLAHGINPRGKPSLYRQITRSALGISLLASASYAIWWYSYHQATLPTKPLAALGNTAEIAKAEPTQEMLAPAAQSRTAVKDHLAQLQQAAESSDLKAQLALAEIYFLGKGIAKNDTLAFNWYQTAANTHSADGQYHAGMMLMQGVGTALDVEKGIDLLSQAARQNHPAAQTLLGKVYLNGQFVPAIAAEAQPWIEAVARQDGSESQYKLGHLFLEGNTVPQDLAQARYWFERAADVGLAKAQYNVGWMMQEGLGGDKNPGKALEWYKKAAKQGYDKAQYSLATRLYHPKATIKTNSEALAWLQKSAAQDFPLALRWLAEINKVGIPGIIAQNQQKADELLQKLQTLEANTTKSP